MHGKRETEEVFGDSWSCERDVLPRTSSVPVFLRSANVWTLTVLPVGRED
jgi:hypothetical protein